MENLVVDWFDSMKGIGEGVSSDGRRVFLSHTKMNESGSFLNLETGDSVTCTISTGSEGNLVASQIQKIDAPKRQSPLEPEAAL